MDGSHTGYLREGPILTGTTTTQQTTSVAPPTGPPAGPPAGEQISGIPIQTQDGNTVMAHVEKSGGMMGSNRPDGTNNVQNPGVGGAGDMNMYEGGRGRDAGQTNFAMGPGPVPGSAGGFQGPGKAAATGGAVVGAGFGPGAVNATPAAKGEYDPMENSKRVPMG